MEPRFPREILHSNVTQFMTFDSGIWIEQIVTRIREDLKTVNTYVRLISLCLINPQTYYCENSPKFNMSQKPTL